MNDLHAVTRRFIAPCLLALALATVSGSTPSQRLPFYDSADFTPSWSPGGGHHVIDDFSLVDQEGAAFTRADLNGRIAVASFIFTRCQGICPRIVGNLMRVQHAFAGDDRVVMVSHSVWPQADTVAVLDRFGAENGIDPAKWRLLTGDHDAIYRLARESYFADQAGAYGRDSSAFIHTENVLLVDPRGRIRGVYNGTMTFDMTRLVEDIRILERTG